MADRLRNSPPLRLSTWLRKHYDELRPDQPLDSKWLSDRVRELGITDRDGKHPSRSALTMAWSREQKRRRAPTAPAPAVVVVPEYKPPEPPPRRPYAVVNPVRIETAPVTAEKPQFRLAKMKE